MSLINVSNIEPMSLYVLFTEKGHTARKMGILLTRPDVQEGKVDFLLSANIWSLNSWLRATSSTQALSEVLSDDFLSNLDGNFVPHNAVKLNAGPLNYYALLSLVIYVMDYIKVPDELLETFLVDFLERAICFVRLDLPYVTGARQVARNVLKRTQSASPGEVVTLRSVMELGPVEEQTGERVVRILE
ncbi:hypothetical protein DFH11DRAFT_453149 [Phellopilus nigrolimitatus]|nr:hypothetical protein DFH11DRAFT_453149 [Phellopilus nigrolimitatus]